MAQSSPAPDPIGSISLSDPKIEFYKREGWLLLPSLLKPESDSEIHGNILDVVEELGFREDALTNASSTVHKLIQTAHYLAGLPLDRMVNSPKLKSIATGLLGGEANIYMPFTAVKSAQSGGEFYFHQDNNYTQFENGLHGINIWFALVDMTPENGCLCIEPRTHTDGTIASKNAGDGDHYKRIAYDPTYYSPVRMHAGDAVAFSRLTVHGSGTNSTTDPRVGYSVQFHHGDARAAWDGNAARALKGADRWQTSPVDAIVPSEEPDDG